MFSSLLQAGIKFIYCSFFYLKQPFKNNEITFVDLSTLLTSFAAPRLHSVYILHHNFIDHFSFNMQTIQITY